MNTIKRIIALLLSLTLVFALAACSGKKPTDTTESESQTKPEPQTEPEPEPETESEPDANPAYPFTLENYPRMGGSLANLPLGQAVTATVLGVSRERANDFITFAGSTTDNYKALVDGDFDILLAYEPSEEAKKYIKNSGTELEMVPIGVDALVFICSNENPVDDLTMDQVKDIYRGKITNWKEVGGNDAEIIPYQRNKDSGSQTLFDKLVNLGDELMDVPIEYRIETMQGLLEAVAEYDNSENALGYTVYYYLTNMESEKLKTSKILSVDGVEPSNETIARGEYPLTNDFYVVIRADEPQNSPVRILQDWITSAQGRELVERENYPVRDK